MEIFLNSLTYRRKEQTNGQLLENLRNSINYNKWKIVGKFHNFTEQLLKFFSKYIFLQEEGKGAWEFSLIYSVTEEINIYMENY